jgi:NAD(P)-dependent dehydrogenase (short-subunit alcohol dehydrogenase family)
MGCLDGRVALVTGGSYGAGRAISRGLAAEGAAVAILARGEQGREVAQAINESGGTAALFRADVADPEEVKAAVDAAAGHFGGLHVVINNAALTSTRRGQDSGRGNAIEMPVEVWQRYFDVNVTGPFLVCKYALPHVLASGGGAVVNVGSIAAQQGMKDDVGYMASKSALHGLTLSIAVDYGPAVRSNQIVTGFIRNLDNPKLAAVTESPESLRQVESLTLTGRIGRAEDLANLCVFLCSDRSGYLTGQSIVMDGGTHSVMRFSSPWK